MSKRASELTAGDKILRFGHALKIKTLKRRIHALTGLTTVCVEHETGIVDYFPGALVPIITNSN